MKTSRTAILLTCEHAGNRIPREYAHLFKGAGELLASHRGWDPGALDFVRGVSRQLHTPFHHVMWSRLLVESNRAPTNPRIWSRFTKDLPIEERRQILEKYWWPNRRDVEASVKKAIGQGKTVLHIAIHSLTNKLDGVERNIDVALLYDSTRPAEKALCVRWEKILNELDPEIRVRRNYPYRGISDGLPTWLRRKFPAGSYLGVEFEFNQALIGTPAFAHVRNVVADSIGMISR
jgi:predicted N-formylglutamate amidohydrolase